MPTYEREAHEILIVEEVTTPNQTATIRRHHTMFCHIKAAAAATAAVGADLVVAVELVTWDTGELITTDDMALTVLVEGQVVNQVATVAGKVQLTIQFADPGTYTLAVIGETVTEATMEVIVA